MPPEIPEVFPCDKKRDIINNEKIRIEKYNYNISIKKSEDRIRLDKQNEDEIVIKGQIKKDNLKTGMNEIPLRINEQNKLYKAPEQIHINPPNKPSSRIIYPDPTKLVKSNSINSDLNKNEEKNKNFQENINNNNQLLKKKLFENNQVKNQLNNKQIEISKNNPIKINQNLINKKEELVNKNEINKHQNQNSNLINFKKKLKKKKKPNEIMKNNLILYKEKQEQVKEMEMNLKSHSSNIPHQKIDIQSPDPKKKILI